MTILVEVMVAVRKAYLELNWKRLSNSVIMMRTIPSKTRRRTSPQMYLRKSLVDSIMLVCALHLWVMFPHLVETVLQIAADLVTSIHTRNHHWGADIESVVGFRTT